MMRENGLVKLCEETGELQQVIGKLLQYPNLQETRNEHPDGTVLLDRLEEELGDLAAAVTFVVYKLKLDKRRIEIRSGLKLDKFILWDKEA